MRPLGHTGVLAGKGQQLVRQTGQTLALFQDTAQQMPLR
jgi:hypothetical protein